MKRILCFILALLLIGSWSAAALAAEISDGNEVVAKYVISHDGEYRAEIADGKATAGDISVDGAPENARTLVVVPMKGEALAWIQSCVEDAGAAYDIHFLDADGNRINADGVSVRVAAAGNEPGVHSVTTSGESRKLSSVTENEGIRFAADGSHYYAITGKQDTVTVPVRGEENTVHADVTVTAEDTVKLEDLDFEEIDHVVGDHVDTGVVEIDLTALDENITKIVLPVTTVEHIVEAAEETHNDTEALQIDFPGGSVKLDDLTMRAVVDQAECNEIMLVLENVGETRLNDTQAAVLDESNVVAGYEVYMLCVSANKRISDFEGGVATVSVPFSVPHGHQEQDYALWHIADDGTVEKLTSRFEDGRLWWDVGHFSDFVVTYEGELSQEHSFTRYESNADATCEKDGTETARCDCGCGKTDTRTDKGSKLGHKYEDGKCVRCGAVQGAPETGDASNAVLWTGLLILSAIGLCFLPIRKRDK